MKNNFWDKTANTYDKNTDKVFREANQRILKETAKYCEENTRLLDMGCGTGTLTLYFRNRLPW